MFVNTGQSFHDNLSEKYLRVVLRHRFQALTQEKFSYARSFKQLLHTKGLDKKPLSTSKISHLQKAKIQVFFFFG